MPVAGCAAELRRVPVFEQVAAQTLRELEPHAFVRKLARGQVLFVEGEPADHLFVVRDGVVKIHLTSAQGADLLLAVLGPGRAIGDVSLVDGGPRSAGATALSKVDLLALPIPAVRAVFDRDHTAVWAVAESLAAGMRRLTVQTADLVFLDLPRRLAKLLLDSAGPDSHGVPTVHLAMTQSDLAAMIGVSRQSLNRALSGFAGRGWIVPGEHSIQLHDRAAMQRFVQT